MRDTYRNILKYAGIYGAAEILMRLVTFCLLPVYTRYLLPAEYGYIAILDLTAAILGILVEGGIVAAVNRYHFEARNEVEQDAIWWTGLTVLIVGATAGLGIAWLLRSPLAHLTLGANDDQGGYSYTLILLTLWFGITGNLLNNYLRIRKWSGRYVSIAIGCLLLNVSLNLYLLIVPRLGVHAILLGNLIIGALKTSIVSVIFIRSRGAYVIQWSLVRELLQFGSPFIIAALLSMILHQADRYLLGLFLDMHSIGIYSLAYAIGQAFNTLYIVPFSSIWSVTMYEVANQPDAKYVYAKVFQYFVYGLMLLMLGVSLFIKPLLSIVLAPSYAEAGNLIPIVCLAYLFFSLHSHFNTPVLLAKKTSYLLPTYFIAAVANIGLNLLSIPLFGIVGAAWTSVLTFIIMSFVGLWRYRTIDQYPYPLSRCGCVLVGMIISYLTYNSLDHMHLHSLWTFIIAAAIWLAWAAVLLGSSAWKLALEWRWNMVQSQV